MKAKRPPKSVRLLIEYLEKEELYLDVEEKGDASVCAIVPLMFTYAIIANCSRLGYENRWCYHNYADAKKAFDAWDGKDGTEPTGWHRHPPSGRRVDPETGEIYVNW